MRKCVIHYFSKKKIILLNFSTYNAQIAIKSIFLKLQFYELIYKTNTCMCSYYFNQLFNIKNNACVFFQHFINFVFIMQYIFLLSSRSLLTKQITEQFTSIIYRWVVHEGRGA